jgi:hypothetical protein
MQIVVGLIFIVLGATCIGYLWAGGSVFDREPPLLVLGVLLIVLTAALAGRARAAGLLARAALGAAIVGIAWLAIRYLIFEPRDSTDVLLRRLYLLDIAVLVVGIVALFVFVRRVPPARHYRIVDVLPLAAFAGVLAIAVLWFVADDGRLRPCRMGNEAACDVVAGRLLDAAERAPGGPPTRWEEDAAYALDARGCRGLEPGPCAVRRYALGTVALRAGRFDVARQAFLRACDDDRSWCARASQQPMLPWTAVERERLERR